MTRLTVHHLGISQSERIVWLCEELGLDYDLVRYDRETGRQTEYNIKLSKLLKDGDSRANVRLEPGDVIIIPESMF